MLIEDYRQEFRERTLLNQVDSKGSPAEESEDPSIRLWESSLFADYDIHHGFIGATVDVQNTEELSRLEESIFSQVDRTLHLKQVHGTELVAAAEVPDGESPEADGAYLHDLEKNRREVLCVRTADCAPVLLSSFACNYLAALHCGWRSAVGGLLPKAVAKAWSFEHRAQDLLLCIGPCAGPCCYEVGTEFVDSLLQAEKSFQFKEEVFSQKDGRTMFDLQLFLLLQAESVGLAVSQLSVIRLCTICDQRFFSYRRQKGDAGRQLSFITNLSAASAIPVFS